MTQDLSPERFGDIRDGSLVKYRDADVLELADELYAAIENDPHRTVEGAKALAAAEILRNRLHGE